MPFILDGTKHDRGTLIITKTDNKNLIDLTDKLSSIAHKHQKEIVATHTGFVDNGKDFGSNTIGAIRKPKIAILSGEPTNTLQFGEVWHYFEEQLGYPVTIIDASYFDQVDLSVYNILVMPDGGGYTNFLNEENTGTIKDWVTAGGKLIAMGHALKPLSKSESFDIKLKQVAQDSNERLPPYEMNQREQIKNEITGAIFKTRSILPTH